MKTPFGTECPYFYGDYFRGKQVEDCRLLNKPNQKKVWQRQLCSNCPVPQIIHANACPNMVLSGNVVKFIGLKKVKVKAYCTKSHQTVKEPKIGCGQCHALPDELILS
jgi:hypothetical protein